MNELPQQRGRDKMKIYFKKKKGEEEEEEENVCFFLFIS